MPRPKLNRPTDGELQILQVLWQLGASTVGDIHFELKKNRKLSQQSVQTAIEIMLEKGLVNRVPDRRPYKYEPAADKASISEVMVKDLATRLFGGSIKRLVQHALSARKSSQKELDEISKIIGKLEDK